MRYLAGIFALLTGAAGWYYLFYSRAAHRLAGVEDDRLNGRRVRLRRVGGVAMLLLGAFFFAGSYAFDDPKQTPGAFLGVWVTVFALLLVIVVLAMVDLRLTRRLRSRQRGSRS
ncbi:MAG: hypothetical protein AVDCRST_MAG64-3759 [uncultured Phycisphaerae bacterium]|uniref:Uncharacterized protein n=1 Tax=uncultured Phycisphaerae bacterium TaxID=904963 RepID=A0A6J4QAV0_9BACT|nr:MAG: hypothetical protein AVDCRST_MAG64-3759 [uncultured Phycisphaerae bacterium]